MHTDGISTRQYQTVPESTRQYKIQDSTRQYKTVQNIKNVMQMNTYACIESHKQNAECK